MSEVKEKQKRKYTRKAKVNIPEEEVPTLELTPMNSFAGLEFEPGPERIKEEEPKPEPAAINPPLTGIRALTQAEEKRHAEMRYILGIIDALVMKHAHRNKITIQEVKDDLITGIIREIEG